jgi:hypothetical protein
MKGEPLLGEVHPVEYIILGVAALFGIPLIPVMVLAVLSFQVRNPLSDEYWDKPNHYDNPFRLGNPLLPTHFAAYFIMCQGAGLIAASPFVGIGWTIHGILVVLGSLQILVGIRLVTRRYKEKMRK